MAADTLKAKLLTKLATCPNDSLVPSQVKAANTLRRLLLKTVNYGEGNSALVIGPRGSGKTTVLSNVLQDVQKEAMQEYTIVQLNGLIHTNDKLALVEITRTLMKSEESSEVYVNMPFAQALNLILATLRSGDREDRSVLIILEEFDLFTHHHNQTLLYNLFDISQSKSVPVAVVGLTCRLDVIELLEKRVKSRFSHIQLFLFCEHSLQEYKESFRKMLTIDSSYDCSPKFNKYWNFEIEKLMTESKVNELLEQMYHHTKDWSLLKKFAKLLISCLGNNKEMIRVQDAVYASNLLFKDSKSSLLQGISMLQLTLIIAMKHLRDIQHDEPFNFEMVYQEFLKFAQRPNSISLCKKEVAKKAFENLEFIELVSSKESQSRSHLKEYQPVVLLVTDEQILETLDKYPNCPTEVVYWGKQSGLAN